MPFIWTRKKPEPVVEAPSPATDEAHKDGSVNAEAEETGSGEHSNNALKDDETEDDEFEENENEEDNLDEIIERVYEWGRAWSESQMFAILKQEQKDQAEFITASFAEYMYNYHGVGPDDWNVSDLEECCLYTLPGKISAEDVYFRSLAPVLSSFFGFLSRTGRLPYASQLDAHIRTLNKRIIKAAADPSRWGMAKSICMAAMAEGVDLTDQAQMDAYIMKHNATILGQNRSLPDQAQEALPPGPSELTVETFERSGPKVGRNDPCPCGSGKKYKKCCGA